MIKGAKGNPLSLLIFQYKLLGHCLVVLRQYNSAIAGKAPSRVATTWKNGTGKRKYLEKNLKVWNFMKHLMVREKSGNFMETEF